MKYLGAYLMAVIGSKESPTAEDVKQILDAGGIEVDDEMLNRVIAKMEGQSAHERVSAGTGKFAACGGGGGGGGAGGGAAAAAAGGGGGGGAVEEEDEEGDMNFDLFG